MRGIKLVLLPLVVAGLSFGLAACGDDDEGDSGDGGGGETSLDMTIGVSLPLSGDLADYGPPGEKAADLALSEINAAIEEVGADHTIEAVKEDNCGAADPQCAVQAQRKLATSDGASCISGPWGSADVIPSAESVSIPEEVPLITPSATGDEITGLDDDGLVNRTSPAGLLPGPDAVARTLSKRRSRVPRVRRSTSALATMPTGPAWRRRSETPGKRLGGEVGEEVVYDIDLPNYDTEADQIVSGNPDGIIIIDFPETYNKVGPALVQDGRVRSVEHVRHRRPDTATWPMPARRQSSACAARRRALRPRASPSEAFDKALKADRAEGRRSSTFDAPELRRRRPLLPGGRRRRVDRRRRHGGRDRP